MKQAKLIALAGVGVIFLIGVIFWNKKHNVSHDIHEQSVTTHSSSTFNLNNFCNNIKIEKLDTILGAKHTKIEHGKTTIKGQIQNYYCKLYYAGGQAVFIAYELGNFEKHLESFTTLEIPYSRVDGFKHKAVIVQSGTKEGLIKVNDSAYITVDYIHPVAEAKTKEILKMFDR